MQSLRVVPPRQSSAGIVHVPPDLFTQSHVFVRHDAICSPLQSPYKGPYHVISLTMKHFTVDVHGKQEIISIDCLKGAHLESDVVQPAESLTTLPVSAPPVFTRSGRHVHFPR